MDLGKLKWAETDMMNQTWKSSLYNNPKSVCSAPCPVAHIRNFLGEKCCWNCFPCRNDEFITNDTCTTCPAGYVPNLPEKLGCLQLPVEYMQWDSAWSIVPYVFAIAGIMCTMFVAIVFFRFNNTPVIMASGRELCYVLLFGIFSNYFMTFVILAKPTSAMCTLLRVGIGLCLSVCYAAIFTKTNRISRIFNRGVRSTKRPQYTSPQSQIVICFGIVSVQLIGILAWLIVEPPSVKEVYPNKRQTVLQCGISQISLIISLLYNMLLIVLCTTYAFKTRKIPENFNEAKYIGFTMYSTCIVWLAFVPIYFGTNNDFKIQTASLCMCISISATVALGCLFVPKVYIVLCQPYKNVRQSSCSQGSASGCTGRTLFSHSTKYSRRTASSAAAAMVAAAVIPVSSSQQTEFTTNGELTSPSMDESSMD
ncbi:GRM4 (predicted) [Pycnogonum litorale]